MTLPRAEGELSALALWTRVRAPEMAVALLLVVLALGMETLDLRGLLKALPGLRAVYHAVPTASITVYDVLAALLFAWALARFLARWRASPRAAPGTAVSRALLAYLAINLLVSVVAPFLVPFARLDWSLLYLLRLAFSMVPYATVVLLEPDEAWLRRYVVLYALLMLLPAVRTVVEGWNPSTMRFRNYFALLSAGGFSAMGLGTYLGSVIGLCVGAIILRKHRPRSATILAWLIPLASLFTVLLTQKRAPFVGVFVLLLAWPLLSRRPGLSDRRRWGLAAVLLLVLVSGALIRGGILNRTYLDDPAMIPQLRNVDQAARLPERLGFLARLGLDPNITWRIAQWYRAGEAALRYPTGVGFRGMAISPYSYPHNQFLQIIDESTLLGFACFLWLTVSALKLALRLWQGSDPLSRVLGSGVYCGLVGVLAQGLFEESFHNWDGMALLWLLIGLAAVQLKRSTSTASAVAAVRPKEQLAS